jgi:hypothetical protein
MINRRKFIKQTGMAAASISLAGISGCGPDQKDKEPAGGRVIDAHIHIR